MFCPQFWGRKWLRQFYGRLEKCAPWKNALFLQDKPMSMKFLVLGGGGSSDFIFMGAGMNSATWWFALRMIWGFCRPGFRTSWQSYVRPKTLLRCSEKWSRRRRDASPQSACRAERNPRPRKPQIRNVQIRNLASAWNLRPKYPDNILKKTPQMPVCGIFFGILGVFSWGSRISARGGMFLEFFGEIPGRAISGLCSRPGRFRKAFWQISPLLEILRRISGSTKCCIWSSETAATFLSSSVRVQPAKSKRGREEGDWTENIINCRDVCRKSSWHFMTTYLAKRRWSLESAGYLELAFLICRWMPQCVMPHMHNAWETDIESLQHWDPKVRGGNPQSITHTHTRFPPNFPLLGMQKETRVPFLFSKFRARCTIFWFTWSGAKLYPNIHSEFRSLEW